MKILINVNLAQVINSIDALHALMEKECSGLLAYKIGKIVLAISDETSAFDSAKQAVAERYGERNANGDLKREENGTIPIRQEYLNEARQELDKIINTEVELNVAPIKLSEIAEMKLSPQDVLPLIPFIEE